MGLIDRHSRPTLNFQRSRVSLFTVYRSLMSNRKIVSVEHKGDEIMISSGISSQALLAHDSLNYSCFVLQMPERSPPILLDPQVEVFLGLCGIGVLFLEMSHCSSSLTRP